MCLWFGNLWGFLVSKSAKWTSHLQFAIILQSSQLHIIPWTKCSTFRTVNIYKYLSVCFSFNEARLILYQQTNKMNSWILVRLKCARILSCDVRMKTKKKREEPKWKNIFAGEIGSCVFVGALTINGYGRILYCICLRFQWGFD